MELLQNPFQTAGSQSQPLMTMIELERHRAELLNRDPGHLTGYDCPECMNRGGFHRVDAEGRRYMEECRCMAIRRSMGYLRRSGLSDLAERYTFDAWENREPWQRKAAETAREYVRGKSGWFVMAGSPGTGKTHLCTAVACALINDGVEARYMLWRDVATRAKAAVNDEEEYQGIVTPLKAVRALYIDDLFKTGKGQEPTVGDVNLAFEILNARYNNIKLLTIISTEKTMEQMLEIDQAVGSRIYERSKGYYLPVEGKKNWRLDG